MYMNIVKVNLNSMAWCGSRHLSLFRLFTKDFHRAKQISFSQLLVFRSFTNTLCARGINFPRRENNTYLEILRAKPECIDTLIPLGETTEKSISVEEWASLLVSNWEDTAPDAVADAFHRATIYAATYNVQITDDRLTPLCKALQNSCSALDDERLMRCLRDLISWPEAESARDPNFSHVWGALDKELLNRVPRWSLPKLLLTLDHWNALHLMRHSRFVRAALRKLLRNPSRLPAAHLTQALFYVNGYRNPGDVTSMIEVEFDLERRLDEVSLEDLSVVAAAFFKGQIKMRSERLLSHMMEVTMKEASTVKDVPLASVLKVLRYSVTSSLTQRFYTLLDRLQEEVPRLSMLACTHVGLAGTSAQLLHEGLMRKVVERTTEQATNVRVKDLERITMAVSVFNLPTSSSGAATNHLGAFEVMVEQELRRRLDSTELQSHPKCLPRTLFFLSQRQIFPKDLIATSLNPDNLKEVYGKTGHCYDLELLGLDVAVGLECPEYDGPRLTAKDRAIVSKKFRGRLPMQGKERGSQAERLLTHLWAAATTVAGSLNRVTVRHLLPQFSLADVVLRLSCSETPLRCLPLPEPFMVEPPSGEPRPAPAPSVEGERWVTLVPLGQNALVYGDGGGRRPSGFPAVHLRQLVLLGYTPVVVPWFALDRSSEMKRADYVRGLLQTAADVPPGTVVAPDLVEEPNAPVVTRNSQATQVQ